MITPVVNSLAEAQSTSKAPPPLPPTTWIEDELVARGPEAPKDPSWTNEDWVMVSPSSYLPFSKRELLTRLVQYQPQSTDREMFMACLEMASLLVNARAAHILDKLKEDFAYFDPTSPVPPGTTPEEFDNRELSFLSGLISTLIKGNFVPLSDHFYRKAIDQRFVLDTPLTVRWDRLDRTPFHRFFNHIDSPAGEGFKKNIGLEGSLRDFVNSPEAFDERALVFHRGLSPFRSDGFYLLPKLDLLLSRIIGILAFPVVYVVEKLMKAPTSIKSPVVDPHAPNAPRRRWVRRLGLENSPLRSLFSRSLLQEPAFREIVVIFRMLEVASKNPFSRLQKKNAEEDQPRRLQIKVFRDIPLADSEIVFPENTPRMRTLDAVLLTVTAIAAAPAVLRAMNGGGSASLVAAVVLCIYVSKVVGQYLRARRMRLARMTKELYHKTRDNDLGVLQYLVDASEEQDLKEIALIYGILLADGRALTEQEADHRIETFLHQKFSGLDVDFEVDDAIRKAVDGTRSLHLLEVTEGSDGQKRYRARPPEQVFGSLQTTWREFGERIGPSYNHSSDKKTDVQLETAISQS